MTAVSLPVANLSTATFECTFGRGCEGICCRNGRPGVTDREVAHIRANLEKFVPCLRPEARALLEGGDFVSRRTKLGRPMLRVVGGWCVFFHRGCVLHAVGAEEGEAFRYKPAVCALFPLDHTPEGEWHVRQHGFAGEAWDLFCLSPSNSDVPASESLRAEIALAERWVGEGKLPARAEKIG